MPDASVRTIDFAVELDGKELPCWAVNYNFEWYPQSSHVFDRSFGTVFRVQHLDSVKVQHHPNIIATEIEIGVGQGLSKLMREQAGVHNIVE